jgi:heterodisulfide reductase subunit C
MSKFEKNMEEVFDVPAKVVTDIKPTNQITTISKQFEVEQMEEDLEKDYQESRKTLKTLITKGNDAIDHLLGIATETEHPRAFEVVATLIKNTAEANEKLLMMQKTMRELKNIKSRDSNLNVDKAIFVGSTSELSKLVKELKNNDR